MKTIKQLLVHADPLRDEPATPESRRESTLQAAVAAASHAKAGDARARFPFFRFAVVGFLVVGVLFMGWRVWPRMSSESYAAVRFEMRLAEDHAGPGLREARIDGKSIYLHEEVVVSNGDIARAEVIPGNSFLEYWVSVEFNESGALKIRQATEGHIGRPIALIVDDEVVVAPVVRSAIGPAAVINGNYTKDHAERIANGLGAN